MSAPPKTISRRRLLSGACMAVAAPSLITARRARAATGGTHLTLLHTNDTHSRLEPFSSGPYKGRGGVARRATLIKRVRAANPNTLVLDAGDTFQGTAWFNAFHGSIDMQALDKLGYHATALGNHDYDAGTETLRNNLDLAPNLKVLSANISIDQSSPLHGRVQPRAILEVGGLKVGLFGLAVVFDGLVHPRLHDGIAYHDPREAAREQVALLREQGCAVVIALSHLGYNGYAGEVGDTQWPKDVPGVNYVVGGHSHTFLERPDRVAHSSGWETAVMQVGHSGLNVGRANLCVDASGRVDLALARPIGVGGRAIA